MKMSNSFSTQCEKYQLLFSPEKYFEDYLSDLNQWQRFFISRLHEVEQNGKLKGPRGIDIGAGPTVHRLAILARFCETLCHADCAERNGLFVKKWLEAKDSPDLHRNFFRYMAQLEGYEAEDDRAKQLENQVRSKIKHIIPCDVTSPQPIAELSKLGGPFDVAVSNGCIECTCTTYQEYVVNLRNIGSILKPGAALVLSGFLNDSNDCSYIVGGIKFRGLCWDSDFVERGLKEAGYTVDFIETDEKDVPPVILEQATTRTVFFSLSYKK